MKEVLKYLFFRIFDFFVFPSKKTVKGTLLVIRLDSIGDYVLFRNYLEVIRNHEKYHNYKITLLGNEVWKSLAETLDVPFVDRFIWVNVNQFTSNLSYRYRKLKEITNTGYEELISPVYSRNFFYDDAIAQIVHAERKTGNTGDAFNMAGWQKKRSDRYFTQLIPAKKQVMFEFYRNREFIEQYLGVNIELQRPFIEKSALPQSGNMKEDYALLFIGASQVYRKWDVKNFVAIAHYLTEKYGLKIVLAGGPNDLTEASELEAQFNGNLINTVGKTTLVELLPLISNARIMISNETSAPHFAVALGVAKVYVLYNGNSFGRFTPYPEEMTKQYTMIAHPAIEKDKAAYQVLSNSEDYFSHLNINEISVEQVIETIDQSFVRKQKEEEHA